jgi:hypothetical protein
MAASYKKQYSMFPKTTSYPELIMANKTEAELKILQELYDLKFGTVNTEIQDLLKQSNFDQLCAINKMYLSVLSDTSKLQHNHLVLKYIMMKAFYPELSSILNLNDHDDIKKFNLRIVSQNDKSIEWKQQYLLLGEYLLYDTNLFDVYISLDDEAEYDELCHLTPEFEKLYYETCCGRSPGTFVNYFKLLLTVSRKNRIEVAKYILKAGYSSLFVAKGICDCFCDLTHDEMKVKFDRAKRLWGDEYINPAHRFEKVFIDLLKMNEIPSEYEIVHMAMKDRECRQDVDYCYWDNERPLEKNKINAATKIRLYAELLECGEIVPNHDDLVGMEYELKYFEQKVGSSKKTRKSSRYRHT